ncbi:hypothetical protein M9Y10_015424 [Tritrichomonas musculus]|uniref:N-acetyltransferase domain-containing protein n=1 Tax=Tritrichomonas musculus TaxID=1915356 RepID=A0ABR2L2A6_9EUKA
MISNFCKRNLTIRKAGPEDCDFIVKLIGQLSQIALNTKKIPINLGIKETYAEMLKDPEHYPIFVAEDRDKNNKVEKLGASISSIQFMLYLGGPYLYLQELVVDDKARDKGVGSALVQHLIKYAKDKKMVALDLIQPENNTACHEERTKFYTKNGFEMGGCYRYMNFREFVKVVD